MNLRELSQLEIQGMANKLNFVYGEEKGRQILDKLINLIGDHLNDKISGPSQSTHKSFVDQSDVILITYGDQFKEEGKPHLETLHEFAAQHLKDVVSAIHILPFYPYSSDDGFSVIDYFKVNPELGTWDNLVSLSEDIDLMFDAVINHISSESSWFQGYLKGNPAYQNFFIETDPEADYSSVTRPRALPLLTKFETADGDKYIWTTFSEDQIDLNFRNEDVLLKIIELLLFYIKMGAKLIRLDAIGYMWKEIGTSCIHLEETHKLVQLFRDVFEIVAPDTIIITETNVPHKDNISYFGNGHNEAQMVYQFPLPPLTLHTFHTGNAKHLLKWADSLEPFSDETTFFNFLASHDGIGVVPVKGILTEEEVQAMADKVKEHGGYVSYKNNGDGTRSPYELNINYYDALTHPNDDEDLSVKRFIASQSILLTLAGVPGIYVHSLLGSRNDQAGVEETGRYRSINREKLQRCDVEKELNDPDSLRFKLFNSFKDLIQKRRSERAFHPLATQKVLFKNDHVFSIMRNSKDGTEKIVCLTNVSNQRQPVTISIEELNIETNTVLLDIVSGMNVSVQEEKVKMTLDPYQVMWIKEM